MSDNHAPYDKPDWGSDVMVDALRQLDLPYIALNPGSSFRGLHDSLVNYAGDEMQMIECPHEKIAVALAHGYAKASGKPMGVILHDLVGLLQGTMGVYYAYIDRAPVLDPRRLRPGRPRAGAGPTSTGSTRRTCRARRSASSPSGTTSRARSSRCPTCSPAPTAIATTGPQGPTYVALDAGLQEDKLDEPVSVDHVAALAAAPSPVAPDPTALRALAQELCDARRPVMVLAYPGRDPQSFHTLVELAELVGIGAVDTHWRLNFPNRHPLCVSDTDVVDDADCVLFVDVKDMVKPTHRTDRLARRNVSRLAAGLPGALPRLRRHGHLLVERGLRAAHPGAPHDRRRHRGRPAAAAGGVPPPRRRRGPGARRRARGVEDRADRAARPHLRPRWAEQAAAKARRDAGGHRAAGRRRCGTSSRSTTGC